MKDLVTFIQESLVKENLEENETKETSVDEASEENVFAVVDNTGAILNVFPTEDEAKDDLKNWPKESEAKVKPIKKSEVEKKD